MAGRKSRAAVNRLSFPVFWQPLSAYVAERGALGVDVSINCVLSLCETIRVAHTFPILHRDLKPDNIIVRSDNPIALTVVDYGLSFNVADSDVTQTNETFQNRFLSLPETTTPRGNRRDPRSDLTALSAILYFCLTGHDPGQLSDASGRLPHMRAGISLRDKCKDERVAQLEQFLTCGLSVIIDNRYQLLQEVEENLQEILAPDRSDSLSDPFELAAMWSKRLRANDRKTQIAEFQKSAGLLFGHINSQAHKYNKKLGRFQLNPNGAGFTPIPTLPEGLDMVSVLPTGHCISAEHHLHQQWR
jgi:serine/threonine protein kinase